MDLDRIREKIDSIDEEILKLLARRFDLCGEISDYKNNNNLNVKDPDREKSIIEKRTKRFSSLGFDDKKFVKEFFELVMKKSRELQR